MDGPQWTVRNRTELNTGFGNLFFVDKILLAKIRNMEFVRLFNVQLQ